MSEITCETRNLVNQDHLSELQICAIQLFQSQRNMAQEPLQQMEQEDDKEEDDESAAADVKTNQVLDCPFCQKQYQSIKSLQAHIRSNHKEEKQVKSKQFNQSSEMMRCMLKNKKQQLCLKEFSKDQMGRHVTNKLHGISRPDKAMVFKGFLPAVGGDGETFTVEWGLKGSKGDTEEETNAEENLMNLGEIESIEVKPSTSACDGATEPKKSSKNCKDLIEEPTTVVNDDSSNATDSVNNLSADSVQEQITFVDVTRAEQTCEEEAVPNLPEDELNVSKEIKNFDANLFEVPVAKITDVENVLWTENIDCAAIETVSTTYDEDVLMQEQNSSFGEMRSQESIISQGSMDSPCNGMSTDNKETNGTNKKVTWDELVSVIHFDADTENDEEMMEVEVQIVPENQIDQERIDTVNVSEVKDLLYDSQETVENSNGGLAMNLKISYFEEAKPGEDWFRMVVLNKRIFPVERSDDTELGGEDFDTNDYDETLSEDEDTVEDSDYDSDDDILETRHRLEMKQTRHHRRNSAVAEASKCDLPNNASFIQDFDEYFTKKCNMSSTTKENTTKSLTFGHLFLYPDSFLLWMMNQDSQFDLSKLIDFKSDENFVALVSPVDWIGAIGGETGTDLPSRQVEKLKSHARLRDFILYRLNKEKFGRRDITLKLSIKEHLKDIQDEVSRLKLFKNLNRMENFRRNKVKQMKQILDPEREHKEYLSVKKWMESTEFKDRENEALKDFEEAKALGKIGKDKFNNIANFVRFLLAVTDKSRPSSYYFLNSDYVAKTKVWLPPDHDNLWSLDNLPQGWNMYSCPDPSVPPTCHQIRLDGSQPQLKRNKPVTLLLNKKCYILMEKYIELKKLKFKQTSLPLDQIFFVNHNGQKLSRIQRSKGSLLTVFASVVGIKDFKMTSLRKAAEGKIQSRPDLSRNTRDLNAHNQNVASDHYDNIAPARRTVFLTSLAATEGSNDPVLSSDDGDLEVIKLSKEEMKQKADEEEAEREKVREEARTFLEALKNEKKCVDLSPSCLTNSEVDFLKTMFSDSDLSSGN